MEYFSALAAALKIEKEFDKKLSAQRVESMSVPERRANGFTWYPVIIKDTELGRGDYLEAVVERTARQEVIHQFRSGVAVALFSNADPRANRLEGVALSVTDNLTRVSFRTDELPDWAYEGKLGLDLLFDETSYEEMAKALKAAGQSDPKQPAFRLVEILTGRKKPTFETALLPVADNRLNKYQQNAVSKILEANDLAIVHGPPGTGKTTVLTDAITRVVREQGRKVLVVAPSNTAVDLLAERLHATGLNVVRIGNPARVSESVNALALDNLMAAHESIREVKRLKKQANEYRSLAGKYKRTFGKEEREQRKALFQEARNINKEIEKIEQYILDSILGKADVIAATLVGANHYTIRQYAFDVVFIDEAAQALEPAAWIPILKSKKVVMAGDHCQLPPTVKSEEALQQGLGVTLMEKCVGLHPEAVVLLEEQYRMNEKIMRFPSGEFYNDRLKAAPAIADALNFAGDEPLVFIDTAGCGFEETREDTSIYNPEEAQFLLKHLKLYLQEPAFAGTAARPEVGVISPYNHQVELLRRLVAEEPGILQEVTAINVSTIDGFQGQECDVVYISMARSNADNNIGFLSDLRRMNVAITRARRKLVIVGDSGTLGAYPFYSDLIAYAEKTGGYKSAWEFLHL